MSTPPAGMTEFIDAMPSSQEPTAVANPTQGGAPQPEAPPAGMQDFVAEELQQELHGGLAEQAKAGLEGVARGATLGGSDVAERYFGVPAENIRGRKEANPIISGLGTIAGGAGLLAFTGGAAAPAEAAMGGAGLGASLLAAGAEGAAFGAGSAVSDAALGEPNLNAQKVLTDIGMGAALGVGAGLLGHGIKSAIGKFGGARGSISEAVSKEADSANRAAQTASAIENTSLKPNAPEIVEIGAKYNLPVEPGMVSAAPGVRQGTEALLSGAPSYSAVRTQNAYQAAHDGAVSVLDQIVPSETISKNQVGAVLQDSLSGQIESEAAPFSELYDAIKQDTQQIPLKDKSAPSIARNILEIPEIKRSFKSPAANLARDIAEEIQSGAITSVDDLRAYQSDLRGRLSPTAPPAEKRILAMVSDKLDSWERRAIRDHASDLISKVNMADPEEAAIWGDKVNRYKSLMNRIDEADKQYAPFREKIGELASWLGKEKIGGARDAISFVKDRLEPEDLINKLTQKKYAGLGEFLGEKFPEQAAVIREYQKNALREASINKDGIFSPKTFFAKVRDLEPEIRDQIFFPDELKKIRDMEMYLSGIPDRFRPSTNPSNTAGATAFRAFFESPTGALIGNARDFGIEQYIKRMGSLPDHLRPNMFQVGNGAAQKFNQMNAVRAMTEKTDSRIAEHIQSILTGGTVGAGAAAVSDHDYKQRIERIREISENPDALSAQMAGHVDGISNHLPMISQGITQSIGQSVAFLNSKIPRAAIHLPLSPEWEPSIAQKQKFNRYYSAVENPISALKLIKSGALTSETMEALRATHPELLKHMQDQIKFSFAPAMAKKLSPPVRRSLSMFLGEPLSNGQMPLVMAANQATFAMPAQRPSEQGVMQGKTTQKGLEKLNVANRVASPLDDQDRRDS